MSQPVNVWTRRPFWAFWRPRWSLLVEEEVYVGIGAWERQRVLLFADDVVDGRPVGGPARHRP